MTRTIARIRGAPILVDPQLITSMRFERVVIGQGIGDRRGQSG